MRNTVIGAVVFLCVLGAQANTISSISPSSIVVASGEHFLRVTGSSLGSQVVYSGPAGTHIVDINARTTTTVEAWIPLQVVHRAGSYSVTVRERGIDSNPVTLTVVGPGKPNFALVVPDALIQAAKTREGAYVKWDLQTIGDPLLSLDCFPQSGSLFKLGRTNVQCTGTSTSGERDQVTFPVNVIDDGVPILKLPEEILLEQTEPGGAYGYYDASAYDDIDGDLRVTCDQPSGSLFRVGRTVVTCNAYDGSLNYNVGAFNVDVKGKAVLTLVVPERLVAEADSPEGAVVEFEVSAYGTEDPEPTIKCDPPSGEFFRLGTTYVTCYAEDRFGQTAKAEFPLEVVDSVGPFINELYTKPVYLTPLDGTMRLVSVVVDALDLVDPFPKCGIVDVTANEKISLDDWRIAGETDVYLRATVESKEADRVYRIEVQCTDSTGNMSSAIANATVPVSGAEPKPGPQSSTSSGKRRAGGK